MPVTHEPWLVALSIAVAMQGAYVGLGISLLVGAAHGWKRRLLLAAASLSLAVAIWSMHFVGMLAARLPFAVDYLVFPTLVSFLVCAIVVGGAVFAVSGGPLRARRLATAAVCMGGGIASMHYIGMTALHASAHMEHVAWLVAASVVVAMAASGFALWLAASHAGRRPPLLLSAAALGLAIAAMHYTAMAGVSLYPLSHQQILAPVLSSDLLAIVVAIVAFLISGIFLLVLMPEQAPTAILPYPAAAVPADMAAPPSADGESGGSETNFENRLMTGRGTFSPLGGAGTPPRRRATQLPYEQEGLTHYLAVDKLVAVHANAHYTYLFDGKAELFCPLAIGDVESRLDERRFVRVHRSHIVNIEKIAGLRRAGDNGLVEMAGEARCTVPVSRSRLGRLKARLRTNAGLAAAGASLGDVVELR
jgi:NO-binding membrane sensor protein with MHYT domain